MRELRGLREDDCLDLWTGDSKDLLLNLPWLVPPSGADREHPSVNKPGGPEGLLPGLCFRTQAGNCPEETKLLQSLNLVSTNCWEQDN